MWSGKFMAIAGIKGCDIIPGGTIKKPYKEK